MATRGTQVVKTVIIQYPSTTRATQIVKITIATVGAAAQPQGLRSMGVGS